MALTSDFEDSKDVLKYIYINDRSFVGGESGLLKSPFNVKPGAFVELKTWGCVSIALKSPKSVSTHHLMDLLVDPVTEQCNVLFNLTHESLDVCLDFLGSKAQLPDSHPQDSVPLPVFAPSN